MWPWLLHVTGVDGGQWLNFWGGFGSDLGEFAIVAALVHGVRARTCHEPRCWRIGHFAEEGTPFRKCRKHHRALGRQP